MKELKWEMWKGRLRRDVGMRNERRLKGNERHQNGTEAKQNESQKRTETQRDG